MIKILDSLDLNQKIALISAGAALLGAIIGALSTLAATWLNKRVQYSGKVSLYAKIVHTKGEINKPWGYYRSEIRQGLYMDLPIWLDVCNTCGVARILRNVNLYAYSDKNEVAAFTQIQRIGEGDDAIHLGENESYTLVIPANSAHRYDLLFELYEQDISPGAKEFDEIILTYFDEKNNIQAFHFVKSSRCWVEGPIDYINQWIALNNKCPYAR